MSGLIPISIVAEFLGKRPEQMKTVIKLDRLPVIDVPAETKPLPKVSLLGLHGWLAERSKNVPLTVDQLEREIDRAAEAVRKRREAKKQRKGAAV